MDNLKKQEMSIFEKWKKTGDPEHFQALYSSMKGLIYGAAKKASFGSNLPESAHQIYAAQNFLDALRTYDPKHGTALQTHVYGAVHQKAKRLNYEFQNLGRMPEPRAQIVGVYQTVTANLHDKLGREPSAAEIADEMSIGIKDVENIRKELHKDLAMGEGTEEQAVFESAKEEETLAYLYYDLTPEEKVVYEYMFGKYGKPRMVRDNNKVDFEGIAKRMGVSPSKVRSIHSQIRAKYEKAAR